MWYFQSPYGATIFIHQNIAIASYITAWTRVFQSPYESFIFSSDRIRIEFPSYEHVRTFNSPYGVFFIHLSEKISKTTILCITIYLSIPLRDLFHSSTKLQRYITFTWHKNGFQSPYGTFSFIILSTHFCSNIVENFQSPYGAFYFHHTKAKVRYLTW